MNRAGRVRLQPNRVHARVRSAAAGHLHQHVGNVLFFVVDRLRAARAGHRQALRDAVNGDDALGVEQETTAHGELPDGAAKLSPQGVGSGGTKR